MNRKLEISAKLEHLSGQDAKKTDADYTDVDHTYNLLYGARHPYYEGYLDWFVIPKSTKFGGLNNLNFKLSYKASPKNIFMFEYSNVSLATNVFKEMDGTSRVYYDKALASTMDFTYLRKVNKTLKWRTGISYGMPTDDFNKMKGITDGGTNYFVYSMVTFSPKFFNSAKK